VRGFVKMKAKVGFTIDREVLKEIDALRDLATRSAFANEILKQGLRAYKATHKKAKPPYPTVTVEIAEETALTREKQKTQTGGAGS
jgi:metal-responsive CopG/Arc/MetJ family transcriptional regulator